MADAELEELVQRFQRLQREEKASHINERNAVEIVNLLTHKKMIELLYTTDAKEYLTWPQLRREIVDEVYASGGRVNVVDLPALLSVHALYVERVLPDVIAEAVPAMRVENGELMTTAYLDTLVQKAADTLRERGSLSVPDFAAQHHLSSKFTHELLADAVRANRLAAVAHEYALYTRQFVRTQRHILRSALLAATRPVQLLDVFARHSLFTPLLDTLSAAVRAELPGRMEGGRYVPACYEAEVDRQVHNVLNSNGYISYDTAQQLGVTNPRQYLLERYNGPTHEGDAAAEPGRGTRAARQRRRGGNQRTTTTTPSGRASAAYPLSGYALHNCFLCDRLLTTLPPALQALVDGDVVAVDLTEQLPFCVHVGLDWPVLAPRVGELYPVLEDSVLLAERVLVASRRDVEERIRAAVVAADPTAEVRVIGTALRLDPDLYSDVLQEAAKVWAGTVAAARAEREATASCSQHVPAVRAALQTALDVAWVELGVVTRGLVWARVQLNDTAATALARHALLGRGFALCRDVLRNESMGQLELCGQVPAALQTATQPAHLQAVLRAFPARTQAALTPMTEALLFEGTSVETLMAVLQRMSGAGTIAVASFHAPNRKLERDTYARLTNGTAAAVRKGADLGTDPEQDFRLFTAICALLAHRIFHVHLELVDGAVASLVTRLVRETSSDVLPPTLSAAHHHVASALQSKQPLGPEGVAALNALRAAVLASCT